MRAGRVLLLLFFQSTIVLAADSLAPSVGPTQAPSVGPTQAPSVGPTQAPSVGSTQAPSVGSTQAPSVEPTQAPSVEPTQAPSVGSTQAPTSQAPTSQAPTSQAPTSQAPTSQAPTSQAPTSQAPTSRPTVSNNSAGSSTLDGINPQYLAAGLITLAVFLCMLGVAAFCEHRKKYDQRFETGEAATLPPTQSTRVIYDDKIGLGLSGGGIRSAAFVSGVLWGLINLIPAEEKKDRGDDVFNGGQTISLPQGHMPKFISCVSGGGYVGSSFTFWSRAKQGADPREWSEEYFERMRKGIGYYWDFSTLWRGLRDVSVTSLMLASLVVLSGLILLPTTYVLGEFILFPYSGYYNAFGDFPSCFPDRVENCVHDEDGTFTYYSNPRVRNMSGNFILMSGAFKNMTGNFNAMSGLFVNHTMSFGSIRDLSGNSINTTGYVADVSGSFVDFSAVFTDMSGSFTNITGGYSNLQGSFSNLTRYQSKSAGGDSRGGISEANNDVIWLLFLFVASGLPLFLVAAWLVSRKAKEELRKTYLGDPSQTRHLRGWKTCAEMLSHLNYSIATFLLIFVFAVFFDFEPELSNEDDEVLLTTTAVLWTLRIIIMYLMIRQSVGLIPLFFMSQILIWVYWKPHRFLWSPEDPDFGDHYQLFAIFSKICIPFMSLLGLLRERMVFEYSRWRLARGFYDAPGKYFTCRYLQRAPPSSKMMWKPPKHGEYPTYIACTTVNSWMLIPPEDMVYDTAGIEREQEFNFWYGCLHPKDRQAIDAVLGEVPVSHALSDAPPSPLDDTRSLFQSVISRKKTGTKQTPEELSTNTILEEAIEKAKKVVLAYLPEMKNHELADRISDFEATKGAQAQDMATSLRELAWSQAQGQDSTYDILAMTTEGWWERYEDGMTAPLKIYARSTDCSPNEDAIVGANPDLLLSEAMCMSAAAGSFLNGEYGGLGKEEERTQVMFGLHMGRWVPTTVKRGASGILIMFVIATIIGAPALIWGKTTDPFERTDMDVSGTNNGHYIEYIGGTLTVFLYILWCAFLPFFSLYLPRIYPFLPRARDMMTLSGVVKWSHTIPSMLYISDGGHTENLGLCPLLARRLRYMVVACGAQDETCEALRSALEQSRKKLGCWFRAVRSDQQRRQVDRITSDNELDLLSDIEFFARDDARVLVIEVIYRSPRRTWRNHASREIVTSEVNMNEKGYIFYLKPITIHPRGFPESSDAPRDEPFGAKCVTRLHRSYEPLAGCCCVGCHPCGCLTRISGKFPFHSTAFQFFTAPLFDAYHAQGVQAMKDAFGVKITAAKDDDIWFDRQPTSREADRLASLVPTVMDGQKKSN